MREPRLVVHHLKMHSNHTEYYSFCRGDPNIRKFIILSKCLKYPTPGDRHPTGYCAFSNGEQSVWASV